MALAFLIEEFPLRCYRVLRVNIEKKCISFCKNKGFLVSHACTSIFISRNGVFSGKISMIQVLRSCLESSLNELR